MKKYSNYFKVLVTFSVVLFLLFILSLPQFINEPTAAAAAITFSFIFGYAAIMTPNHERLSKKYYNSKRFEDLFILPDCEWDNNILKQDKM